MGSVLDLSVKGKGSSLEKPPNYFVHGTSYNYTQWLTCRQEVLYKIIYFLHLEPSPALPRKYCINLCTVATPY